LIQRQIEPEHVDTRLAKEAEVRRIRALAD
jgi:hypothetical protein